MDNTEPFVDYILNLREKPGPRAALRRGRSQATAHYAYPFLASWWTDRAYLRDPMLTFGSLCAEFNALPQADGQGLGSVSRSLVDAGAMNEEGLSRKLLVAQNSELTTIVPSLRIVLSGAKSKNLGVDWHSLYRMCRMWDHKDPAIRTRVRRRILEDFYQPTEPKEKENEVS